MTADDEPAGGGPGPAPAVHLAAAWAVVLALLAVLWVRSPFTGPGPMFLAWSAAGIPLAIVTWRRLRRWGILQVPLGTVPLLGLAAGWVVSAWLTRSPLPGVWAMDGEILRRPLLEAAGVGLQWLPGVFGLGVCVAGLSAALEARYRLARGDVARREADAQGRNGPTPQGS